MAHPINWYDPLCVRVFRLSAYPVLTEHLEEHRVWDFVRKDFHCPNTLSNVYATVYECRYCAWHRLNGKK